MLRLLCLHDRSDHIVYDYTGDGWSTRATLAYNNWPMFVRAIDDRFLLTMRFGDLLGSGMLDSAGIWHREPTWDVFAPFTWSLFLHGGDLWLSDVSIDMRMQAIHAPSGKRTDCIKCTGNMLPFHPLSINDSIYITGNNDSPARDGVIGIIKAVPSDYSVQSVNYVDAMVTGPTCVSVYSPNHSMMFMRDLRVDEPEKVHVWCDHVPDPEDVRNSHHLYERSIMPDGNIASTHVCDSDQSPYVVLIDMRSPMEHYELPAPAGFDGWWFSSFTCW